MTNGTVDSEAIKTYRYLRIGMVGLVVLLAASVLYERAEATCWLTSISAYYYTPVRAIFVGGLFAIGFALIVIKGNTPTEDAALNAAGMFAPIVAVVPTEFEASKCLWLLPDEDTGLASVQANIDNNFTSLLVAGFFGLVVALVIVLIVKRHDLGGMVSAGARPIGIGLVSAFVLLVIGALLYRYWDDFDTRMHGYSAVAMFAFLAIAVALNAWAHRADLDVYFWLYAGVAVLMVVTAAVVFTAGKRWDHGVLILEAIEISLFAVFWIVQTVELWDETTRGTSPASTPAPAPTATP